MRVIVPWNCAVVRVFEINSGRLFEGEQGRPYRAFYDPSMPSSAAFILDPGPSLHSLIDLQLYCGGLCLPARSLRPVHRLPATPNHYWRAN
jgi:hypothetical protein